MSSRFGTILEFPVIRFVKPKKKRNSDPVAEIPVHTRVGTSYLEPKKTRTVRVNGSVTYARFV